jgi:UDP-3-O-[3-hydroxymyristoyl] glucosamine N-acyltransferase
MKFKEAIPLSQIAEWTQCEVIGPADALVTGLNEIHNVQHGDITFVDHEKYYDFTLRSSASFIIINKKLDAPQGKALLYTDNPFKVYNELAQRFKPDVFAQQAVSGSAVIGTDTYIYPNAFIGEFVKIGKNCVIHPNVTIYNYSEIGDNVTIHANTTIGSDAFYYKRHPTH